MVFSVLAIAQNKTLTGTVLSETDKQPVPGASVIAKGSKLGTQTDANGRFSLSVPNATTTLVISVIGFTSQEVAVSGASVQVTLKEDLRALSEVVITGYAQQSRREVTGAISTIRGDEIASMPIASFDQALQGKMAGVLVQANSGQPGASANILIRGKGSILGSNAPLYILDGVEITSGDFSTLNQQDFESISVLKDAAATAPYGSRGANGVVLINSKKGKVGAMKVSYDGQYGFSREPENKLVLMTTNEKLDYELANGNPYGWTAAEVTDLRKINTDWEDIFFKTGHTGTHALSASGGSTNTTYLFSGSYFKQKGTVPNTGLKRYTGRANAEATAGDFKIGLNATGGFSDFTNTSEANTGIATPLNAVRWLNPYETPFEADGIKYKQIVSGQPNALLELIENTNLRQQFKGVGNVNLSYNAPFLKGLTVRTLWGGDYRTNENSAFIDPITYSGSGSTGNKGSYNRANDRSFRYTGTTSLSYTTAIAEDHTLTASVYNEVVKTSTKNFTFTGYGLGGAFENESGITPGTATNNFIPIVGGGGGENALLSYFADLKYGFKSRYFLTASGRRDGSSRFGANKKWASFGSVGASWIITDEPFMEGLVEKGIFDDLKLRASYGSSGNQAGIGNFESRELYSRAVYNGVSGLVQTQLANLDLQWERKTTTNVALDFASFGGRLSGTVEAYNSLTTDLFLNRQLSRTTGYTSLNSNIGELQNRGIEASLNGEVLKGKGFSLSLNATFTYNKNKVKKLVGDQQEIISGIVINRVGESMNTLFLVPYAGVNPANGNAQYVKLDGSITETYSAADRVLLGSSEAPYFGSFGSTVGYKGIEVSAMFSFITGHKLFNNDRTNVENPAYYYDNLAASLLTEWRTPGQITNVPRFANAYQSATSRYVESGDFLRLRNATVSYLLPQSILRNVKLNAARFYVQGQNLVTWTKFLGFDPELSTTTLTGAQYPALRTVTFGLTLGI